MVSSSLLLIAIQTVNTTLARHCYQEKEPSSLKNIIIFRKENLNIYGKPFSHSFLFIKYISYQS